MADSVFPTHAIAGARQSAPQKISAPTFGLRANYTITKTFGGYSVTDFVGNTQTVGLSATQIVFSDMTVNLGIGDKSKTISAANLQSLIELYIAYFNRVPDADGLSYWIDQLVIGQSLDQIGTTFYNAAVYYSSLTGYSASMTNSEFITVIYKNVLGRSSVDEGGLAYWNSALASGSATRGTLVRSILASAHTFKGNATYGYVADLLDNKVEFANFFTIQLGLNYNTPEDSIKNTMAMVAAITPTSTTGAISLMNSYECASSAGNESNFTYIWSLSKTTISITNNNRCDSLFILGASQPLGSYTMPPVVAVNRLLKPNESLSILVSNPYYDTWKPGIVFSTQDGLSYLYTPKQAGTPQDWKLPIKVIDSGKTEVASVSGFGIQYQLQSSEDRYGDCQNFTWTNRQNGEYQVKPEASTLPGICYVGNIKGVLDNGNSVYMPALRYYYLRK